MEDSLENRLIKFVKEIEFVSRPDNPGKTYNINDLFTKGKLDDFCFVLLKLIEDKNNDASLIRLEDDFKTHLNTVIECTSFDNLPIAIEGLAQKYESFLKKIGYLKYQESPHWGGNSVSAGITGTTLKMLCDGVIANRYGKENHEQLILDDPLINYKGVARSLIDFLRNKLRNAVHYAPNINRKHLIPYSEIVIVSYLLAIQDNIKFLGPRYLSRLALDKRILSTHDSLQHSYVKNKFSENSNDNLIQFEPRLSESIDSIKEKSNQKREGTITEVFSKVNKFVIKGIGGLGKTTTLRFFSNYLIEHENATPLFFPLKDYRNGVNLIDQILLESEISIEEFEADLKNNTKYVFLLDGLNEIIDLNKRSELIIELKFLFKRYKNCGIILSSRKIPELAQIELPIFNIQAFDYNSIVEYLEKNFKEIASRLIINLNQSGKLLKLCSNPLLLQILCTVYDHENLAITNNQALIIKTFVKKSLERERLKNHKIDIQKLTHYLMDLGYYTRFNASVSFTQHEALDILSRSSKQISPGDDKIEVLNLLKDVNFIIQTNNGLSFNHELYQEYFAAEGLNFYGNNLEEFQSIDHWRNPILMYSGLSEKRHDFINSVANTDTLLAAECITTSIIFENEIEVDIMEKSIQSMRNSNDINDYNNGVLALLQLKRYDELKENLPKKSKDLGDLVRPREELDGLSIVQTIIRELDSTHLLEFIQLLLARSISYRNDIIRGLMDRDSEELKPIIDKIRDLVLSTITSEINSTNLLNLIILFGKENIIINDFDLNKEILSRILVSKSLSSPALAIAEELELIKDLEDICQLIEVADKDLIGVENFVKIMCEHFIHNNIDRKRIIYSASKSQNLLLYLSGCTYVAQNKYKIYEDYFIKYEVFSNKYFIKVMNQNGRDFSKTVSYLEYQILKKYGPHRTFKRFMGRTYKFNILSKSHHQILLILNNGDDSVQAKWKGKNAATFLASDSYNEANISLTVIDIDFRKGILLVDKKEVIKVVQKVNKVKSISQSIDSNKIKPTRETLLGTKLKDAISGKYNKEL